MNKKLIKTLGCLVGISAIGSIVPIVATLSGCSNKSKIIPEGAYAIDETTGTLNGWAEGWDAEKIIKDGYDTMIIPKNVKIIATAAFINSAKYQIPPIKLVLNSELLTINDYAFMSTPIVSIDFSKSKNLQSIGRSAITGSPSGVFDEYSTLTTLNLSSCTSLTSIGMYAFMDFPLLTSITLPSNLNTIGGRFLRRSNEGSRELRIEWNDLNEELISTKNIDSGAFALPWDTGTVKSNSNNYSSEDLLEFLKSKGLPKDGSWTAVTNK